MLVFFVDAMIAESALPFAQKWNNNRLAVARGEQHNVEGYRQRKDAERRRATRKGGR